ncbi:MAG: UDP-glucose 4-epimerase [Flavobacteriaceae bacterium]|nr:UDP-glucose 4-epimerase [Flavobacteriaceae bacterium]
MKKRKLLITGANGFVGRNLIRAFETKYELVTIFRSPPQKKPVDGEWQVQISGDLSFSDLMRDVDCVIHSAACVHLGRKEQRKKEDEIFEVNVNQTLELAHQAARSGVKRFLFFSTIAVNGTSNRVSFTETDVPQPNSIYAKSKLEAEAGLWKIADRYDLEIVIIRPPMVYGPNAPGNFSSLLSVLKKFSLLPIGGIKNKRSFLHIENLVSLVSLCLYHPNAANQLFLAADGHSLSTRTFVKLVAQAANLNCRIFWFPPILLRGVFLIIGKNHLSKSLLDSLLIDTSKARTLLNWYPTILPRQGIGSIFCDFQSEE